MCTSKPATLSDNFSVHLSIVPVLKIILPMCAWRVRRLLSQCIGRDMNDMKVNLEPLFHFTLTRQNFRSEARYPHKPSPTSSLHQADVFYSIFFINFNVTAILPRSRFTAPLVAIEKSYFLLSSLATRTLWDGITQSVCIDVTRILSVHIAYIIQSIDCNAGIVCSLLEFTDITLNALSR